LFLSNFSSLAVSETCMRPPEQEAPGGEVAS
jgi:hypothetical protein